MKLSVISEVANPKLSNMDGVDVSIGFDNEVVYDFVDPNVPEVWYKIIIEQLNNNNLDSFFKLDPVFNHIRTNDPGRGSYVLNLSVYHEDTDPDDEDSLYSKTGAGNFGFVYGKLMTCVIDFFVTRKTKVLFLFYRGMTKDMELVYKRFMERLNAEYPLMAMRPYEPESLPQTPIGFYISIDAIESIKDDNLKQQAYNSIKGQKHSERLKKIRELKKARDPQHHGEIY
jgi:hypothetical protein